MLEREAQLMSEGTSSQEESNSAANGSRSEQDGNLARKPITIREGQRFPTQTTLVVDLTPKNEELNLSYLTDVVNLLIQVHSDENHHKNLDRRIAPSRTEVVLLLTSPGGGVASYGLAAAQVYRLEKAGIRTTLCVDYIAASGGYMIASQTSQILAAPFAMVGFRSLARGTAQNWRAITLRSSCFEGTPRKEE